MDSAISWRGVSHNSFNGKPKASVFSHSALALADAFGLPLHERLQNLTLRRSRKVALPKRSARFLVPTLQLGNAVSRGAFEAELRGQS
jgi:hypothetical protein